MRGGYAGQRHAGDGGAPETKHVPGIPARQGPTMPEQLTKRARLRGAVSALWTARVGFGVAAIFAVAAVLAGVSGAQVAAGQEIVHGAKESIATIPVASLSGGTDLASPVWAGLLAAHSDAEWVALNAETVRSQQASNAAVRARAMRRVDSTIWLPGVRQLFVDRANHIDVAGAGAGVEAARANATRAGWAYCTNEPAGQTPPSQRALARAVQHYLDTHRSVCAGDM